jgi:hypothetical protein
MVKFLLGAAAVLVLGPGPLGQAGVESRPPTHDPLAHALVRGQLRSLDLPHGTLEMLTADGLKRISSPHTKVITPRGQVCSLADCPPVLVRPGQMVRVVTTRSGDAIVAVIVDLRQPAPR